MDEAEKKELSLEQTEEILNASSAEQVISKKERIEKEKQELLNRVVSGQIEILTMPAILI